MKNLESRKQFWEVASQTVFDAVVIGGGISGAAIFDNLSARGFRTLLIEKGDFAGGTSQASSMMIWGSLPDLARLSFLKVARLCASRERLMRERKDLVHPQTFRYLPHVESGRKSLSAYAALYSYWILGGAQRSFPRRRKNFAERPFLKPEKFPVSFEYEEAAVVSSDARFVLAWILPHLSADRIAFNYCLLAGGSFESSAGLWRLEAFDSILKTEKEIKTRWVVNAAGIWTDRLNRQFKIETPYKHALGKGVFINLKRDERHRSPLMIETREREGCLAFTPWGPVSLWGPTETRIEEPAQGFKVEPAEIRFLLKELNRHLSESVSIEDIVALRCGVRPIAVKQNFPADRNTSGLPREYRLCTDKTLPWLSVYGGKLTSCVELAETVASVLQRRLVPSAIAPKNTAPPAAPELETFPGIDEKVVSARWSAEREMCWTLEDYLRRRTNISQWISRGGFGPRDENYGKLADLAKVFSVSEKQAAAAVDAYRQKIKLSSEEVLSKAA